MTAAFVGVTRTENALSSVPASMTCVSYSSYQNDYSSFKACSIPSFSCLVDGTADLVRRKKLKQSTKPVSFNDFGTSTAPPPQVLEFMQSFGSSDVTLLSRHHVSHLSGSTCGDGQELTSHEPVPLDPTQQPNADENCPPFSLHHAPHSVPVPLAPLGIAALVANVALHRKDSAGITPSSKSGAPVGSITMVTSGDAPQQCRQSWNPTGPAKGRVSVLDGFESEHDKDTHHGSAIPARKSLFITCIFASTRVFFLAAATILLHLVCQPQVNVGSSPSLSMEDFFGPKRCCENDETPSIENVAPVDRIAFVILSIVMVFLCDHINWRYFSRKAVRFLCYFTQYHDLSTCRLASQFCPTSLSPCQPTDVVFSTPPSPRQAIHRHATSMASWPHGRLASISNVKNMVISFNLRRAYSVFRAIALFSVLRITWLKRKQLCMKRVATSVALVLCISTAPLCAKAQVCVQPSDL